MLLVHRIFMNHNSFLFIICALFSLAGCTGGASQVKATNQQLPPDPAIAKLAEAAKSSSHSALSLAEIELAVSPPPPDYLPIDPASYGMANLVSVDWAGPIAPIVQRIANASGFQMKTFGTEPAVPLLVFVQVKNKPLGDVLRDVGYQVHSKASLVVYPNTRVIELRYAEA